MFIIGFVVVKIDRKSKKVIGCEPFTGFKILFRLKEALAEAWIFNPIHFLLTPEMNKKSVERVSRLVQQEQVY